MSGPNFDGRKWEQVIFRCCWQRPRILPDVLQRTGQSPTAKMCLPQGDCTAPVDVPTSQGNEASNVCPLLTPTGLEGRNCISLFFMSGAQGQV